MDDLTIELMKEIIKLKEHIKDLENEQISEMKEHEEFCKIAKEKVNELTPKYKPGDEVYAIISTTLYERIDKVKIVRPEVVYVVDDGEDKTTQHESRIFDTEEEAKNKLKELDGMTK